MHFVPIGPPLFFRFAALLALTLVLLLPAVSFAGAKTMTLPEGTLTADEIVSLFSNHTVESVTAVKGRVSLSFYAPDGELRQMRHGKKRHGTWRVTPNDRICLQMEDLPEKCRIIVREGGVYKKYIVKKNGRHQHSVTYRSFVKGNPYGI